jgi:hypothetical protein
MAIPVISYLTPVMILYPHWATLKDGHALTMYIILPLPLVSIPLNPSISPYSELVRFD